MIITQKQTDEHREAGPVECWCLHGSVGMAADFRGLARDLAKRKIGTHAVDLWRFLACQSLPIGRFGEVLNAEVGGRVFRGSSRMLMGYSLGGRLALHALLSGGAVPWQSAVIVSAHPGLEDVAERMQRREQDAGWAGRALTQPWKDFMADWNGQPLLGGPMLRDAQALQSLSLNRREVARSFVDWSLGAQEPLWERLPEIRQPVLWVVGEQDEKYRGLAERAVARIPRAKLVVAPASGHRVPWQAGEWLAEQIGEFSQRGVESS